MRIESTRSKDEYRVWLTPDEADTLKEVARTVSEQHHLTVLIGLTTGLRAHEYLQLRRDRIRRTQDGSFLARIPKGKDTTGTGGKTRDVYVPDQTERALLGFERDHNIPESEPYFPVDVSTIRRWVKEVAEQAAEYARTDDAEVEVNGNPDDWTKLSSHDLRRYWAQTCLRRRDMDARIVQAVGGWSSYEAMEPYMATPSPENITSEFTEKF